MGSPIVVPRCRGKRRRRKKKGRQPIKLSENSLKLIELIAPFLPSISFPYEQEEKVEKKERERGKEKKETEGRRRLVLLSPSFLFCSFYSLSQSNPLSFFSRPYFFARA